MAQAKHNRAPAQINRRNILAAAPAFGLAGLMAGAVPVAAQAETPVMRAYREWKTALDAWNQAAADDILPEDDLTCH